MRGIPRRALAVVTCVGRAVFSLQGHREKRQNSRRTCASGTNSIWKGKLIPKCPQTRVSGACWVPQAPPTQSCVDVMLRPALRVFYQSSVFHPELCRRVPRSQGHGSTASSHRVAREHRHGAARIYTSDEATTILAGEKSPDWDQPPVLDLGRVDTTTESLRRDG